MEARRRGYVASNLIAAFVTGADGSFDAVIKKFIPFEFDSIFGFIPPTILTKSKYFITLKLPQTRVNFPIYDSAYLFL